MPGPTLNCDDGIACSADSCDPQIGCVHVSGDADFDGFCDLLDNCPDVANSGQENADGDAAGDVCDCAPGDFNVYHIPSEATKLQLDSVIATTLFWNPPDAPGGTQVVYDVLRSESPSNFALTEPMTICLASGIPAEAASDLGPQPPVDHTWFYLVRSRNACGGNLGKSSAGVPRLGRSCP
jgi:hypothetical protein